MSTAIDVLQAAAPDTSPITKWLTRWVYFARNRVDGLAWVNNKRVFVRAGDIKIGVSSRPVLRARDLKSDLLAVVRGGYQLERKIHQALPPSSRIKGEWYHPTPEVLDVIEVAKARDDANGHYWPPRVPYGPHIPAAHAEATR
jgi:hypothetical protein